MVKDTYQSGQLVSESDGNGTLLVTFTYDVNDVPSSVQVGSDLTMATTDANGTTVATYSHDATTTVL